VTQAKQGAVARGKGALASEAGGVVVLGWKKARVWCCGGRGCVIQGRWRRVLRGRLKETERESECQFRGESAFA